MTNKNAAQKPMRIILDSAREIYVCHPGQDVLLEGYGWATLYNISRIKEKSISPGDLITFVQMDKDKACFISGNFSEFRADPRRAYFNNSLCSTMPEGHPETHLARLLVKGWAKTGNLRKILGASR